MSSPISPITGPSDPLSSTRPSAGGSADGVFASELQAARAGDLGPSRIGPPKEVLDEVAQAGRLYEELRRDGHVLAFLPSDSGEAPTIELRDLRGNTVRTLTSTEAFAIAAGQPVE